MRVGRKLTSRSDLRGMGPGVLGALERAWGADREAWAPDPAQFCMVHTCIFQGEGRGFHEIPKGSGAS